MIISENTLIGKLKRLISRSVILQSILFSVFAFLVFLALWNQDVWTHDEPEMFIKGQQIMRGGLLYKDVDSQHMPLMYHLSAVFARMGFSGMAGFRAAFFALFALLLGIMYLQYSSFMGKRTFYVSLIAYVSISITVWHGTCVLSDQLQGIGMAILFMQLLCYEKEKKWTAGSCICCSLAAFISFGSAFVSVFAIFAFYVGIALIILSEEKTLKAAVKRGAVDAGRMALAMALPFVDYLLYFFRTHTAGAFFKWAYRFNTEVYSKYMVNNYGSSIPGALFYGISNIAKTFVVDSVSTTALIHIAVIALCMFFVLEKWKENRILAISVVVFVIACATRDCFGFHGLPVIWVFSVMIGSVFNKYFDSLMERIKGNTLKQLVLAIAAVTFCAGYLQVANQLFSFSLKESYNTGSEEYALKILGDEYEEVGYFNFDHELLLKGHKLPANPSMAVYPWFWEWEHDKVMKSLQKKKPRIFCYRTGQEVWGYKVSKCSPEIEELLRTEYTALNDLGFPDLYVRNDYFYEAAAVLEGDKVFTTYKNFGNCGQLIKGDVISQPFIAYRDTVIDRIDLLLTDFSRVNDCHLQVSITDVESGETTKLGGISCEGVVNSAYNRINLKRYSLEKGKEYRINIISQDGRDGNAVALYHGDRAMTETYRETERGVVYPLTIAMNVYCEKEFLPGQVR